MTKSRSTSELYDKCCMEQWEEIVIMPNYHELIRAAIELYTKELLDSQRKNMLNFAYSYCGEYDKCEIQQSEFKKIFLLNEIDPKQFCFDLINVLLKKHPKINCLRLVGIPNSCKTLIANCIVNPFVCCYNNNHGSENEFYLSNFLNKSIILCEELYITIATAEDFKSVLGGQTLDIAKKYNEKQLLGRTPIIITTNYHKFGRGHLSETDENALRLRCHNYIFNAAYSPSVKLDTYNFYKFVYDCMH